MDALHKVACRGSSATSVDGDRLKAEAIAAAFAWCFYREFNTELVGGAPEPLYRPGSTTGPAQLMYREDFPASALHEAAHWCIAGKARRQQEDFGYHYIAGPRTAAQQAAFFALELRAQCLEKQFAKAAGLDFLPSADNFQADLVAFSARIRAFEPELSNWLVSPAGARARRFIACLQRRFGDQSNRLASETESNGDPGTAALTGWGLD